MEMRKTYIKLGVISINVLLIALNLFNMCMTIWMLGGWFVYWKISIKYPVITFLILVFLGATMQIIFNAFVKNKLRKRDIKLKTWEFSISAIAIFAFTVIAIIPFIVYGAPVVFMKN